jgi:tetratricopeptide (TPR) repeat protein
MARRVTSRYRPDKDNARDLAEAMFDPELFGLEYAPVVTATAEETLKAGRGNCLSLAAVYVGLARAAGLEAHFLDASRRVAEEINKSEDLKVKTGHVTAQVKHPDGEVILYVGGDVEQDVHQWLRRHTLKAMDDITATAHFYNNRAYERIHDALQRDEPVDWARAARDFGLATRVKPDFEPAWNNLGVAQSRLGRRTEAMRCYRKALELDPDSGSARANLELLE